MASYDLLDSCGHLRMVAYELALRYFDFGARLHESYGLPHLSFSGDFEVFPASGRASVLGVLDMRDELVVAEPGVFFHPAGDGDGSAVVVDVGVGFRGCPDDSAVLWVFDRAQRAA